MPTFDTPGPIALAAEIAIGDLDIVASDRADTVVTVLPSDENDESDVQAARRTRVEYSHETLLIKSAKARARDFFTQKGSVEVSVELPIRSRLYGGLTAGDLRGTGQLGECAVGTSTGHVRLERTGPLRLRTSVGDIAVEHVTGRAEITTGSGRLWLGTLDGGSLKNSNGRTHIDTSTGALRVRAANGDISVQRTFAEFEARAANGNLRVGEVVSGSVDLKASMGHLDIGITDGNAAWLDVNTQHGRLHNGLDDSPDKPEHVENAISVRANTSFGDITIRRRGANAGSQPVGSR